MDLWDFGKSKMQTRSNKTSKRNVPRMIDKVNKLGQKNPNILHLIVAFDLVDENGMEIRNQKTA